MDAKEPLDEEKEALDFANRCVELIRGRTETEFLPMIADIFRAKLILALKQERGYYDALYDRLIKSEMEIINCMSENRRNINKMAEVLLLYTGKSKKQEDERINKIAESLDKRAAIAEKWGDSGRATASAFREVAENIRNGTL